VTNNVHKFYTLYTVVDLQYNYSHDVVLLVMVWHMLYVDRVLDEADIDKYLSAIADKD